MVILEVLLNYNRDNLKSISRPFFTAIALLLTFNLIAQPEKLINQWVPVGDVNDLTVHPDGESVFLAGEFDYLTLFKQYAVTVDSGNYLPQNSLDFEGGSVNDVIPDGNGGWYVAGDFEKYDPDVPNGLFHLHADFSIDPEFPKARGFVNDIALVGDTLYVVGEFTKLGETPRYGVGIIDTQTSQVLDLDVKIHGEVNTMELFSDKLYLGGSFDAINEFGEYGTQLDKSTGNINIFCDAPNSYVKVSEPDGNGGYFISGNFNMVGDSLRFKLAHINADGKVSSWKCDLSHPGGTEVRDLLVHDDFLYLVGDFSRMNGKRRENGARVDLLTGDVDAWDPNISGVPTCIEIHNGSIYIGGGLYMDRAGAWVRNGGVVDLSASVLMPEADDIDYSISNSTPDGDGGFFIEGGIQTVGDSSVSGIIQLDSNGALTDFTIDSETEMGGSSSIQYSNGILYIAANSSGLYAVDANGSLVETGLPNFSNLSIDRMEMAGDNLVLIGEFIDDDEFDKLTIKIVSLVDNQVLDFEPVITKGPLPPPGTSRKFDVELVGDTLFIAGNFVDIDGEEVSKLAALDINTGDVLNFLPVISGRSTELASHENYLFVGGYPGIINGQQTGKLAVLDSQTGELLNNDSFFHSGSLISTETTALKIFDDTLFVGLSSTDQSSSFSHFRNYAFAIDPQTQEYLEFNPGAVGDVQTISKNGPALFIGGQLEHLGGDSIRGFAAYELESGEFLQDEIIFHGIINSLEAYDDLLLAAGSYIKVFEGQQKSIVAFDFSEYEEEILFDSFDPIVGIDEIEIWNDVLYIGDDNFNDPQLKNVLGFDLNTYEFNDINIDLNLSFSTGYFKDIEVDSSGIYVAHSSSILPDVTASYVSAWDLETGDPIANWGIEFSGGGGSFTPPVSTISLQGNSMYIGGSASLISNSRIKNAVAVSLETGTPTSWSPEFNEEVHALLAADSAMYVGGKFTSFSIGLQNYGEAYIAKLDTETAEPIWHLFDLFIDNTVLDLEYDPAQNWIYASGEFNMEDGSPTNYVSAYSLDEDWRVTDWNPGPLEYPQKMTMHNGELWIFENAGLSNTPYTLYSRKILESGEFSEDSIPFFGSWLNAMAFQDDKIFMGGRFFGAGGIQRKNLAELDVESGLPTDFSPNLPLNEIQHVGISESKVVAMGNTETDPELFVFDIDTYELIPGFENESLWPSSYFSHFELYNNNLFFNFGYGLLRRKSLLTGENLEVPSPNIYYDNRSFKGASDYLYSWQQTLDWDLGMDVDTLVRTDLQNPEWEGLNVHADSLIHDMAELNDKIYFTGNFTEVNGLSREGMFRLDGETGTLDDWSVDGLDFGESSKVFSTTHSIFRFVRNPIGGDKYELRRIEPTTGEASSWYLKQEPVAIVEAGNKLYVAGEVLPEEVPYLEKFAVYNMNTCNTEIDCQDVTLYLDETGLAELTLTEVNLGADSDCTIQDIFLSNSIFSCEDVGVSSTSIIVTTDDGLKGSCNAQVTVIDTIAPSLSIEDLELVIPESGELIISPDSFNIISSANCEIAEIEILSQTVFSCEDEGETLPVIFTATDYSGNQSQVEASVSILPSPVCCETSAEFETTFMTACLGDTVIFPLNLSGTYPFEVTFSTYEQDTISYTLENPDDSIFVVIESSAFTSFSLISVSDAECIANGFSTFFISTNPSAGPDQQIELCATGEEVILDEYLSNHAAEGSIFTGEQILDATVENSGSQLLVYESLECGLDTAVYNFNFTEPGEASNIQIICNSPINFFYQVSFDIVEGNPPYSVNGIPVEEGSFLSNPQSIVESPALEFLVTDHSGCEFLVEVNVPDQDGDGVCDDDEIVGCMNPEASNYNPNATDPAICSFDPTPAPFFLTEEMQELDGFWRPLSSGSSEPLLALNWNYKIYPNPIKFDEIFWIKLNTYLEEMASMTITDGTGRVVFKNEFQFQSGILNYQVDVDRKLPPGIYVSSIRTSLGVISKKLIIQ